MECHSYKVMRILSGFIVVYTNIEEKGRIGNINYEKEEYLYQIP